MNKRRISGAACVTAIALFLIAADFGATALGMSRTEQHNWAVAASLWLLFAALYLLFDHHND